MAYHVDYQCQDRAADHRDGYEVQNVAAGYSHENVERQQDNEHEHYREQPHNLHQPEIHQHDERRRRVVFVYLAGAVVGFLAGVSLDVLAFQR